MEEEGLSPVMKRGGGFMRLEGVCAVLRPREDDGGGSPASPAPLGRLQSARADWFLP